MLFSSLFGFYNYLRYVAVTLTKPWMTARGPQFFLCLVKRLSFTLCNLLLRRGKLNDIVKSFLEIFEVFSHGEFPWLFPSMIVTPTSNELENRCNSLKIVKREAV